MKKVLGLIFKLEILIFLLLVLVDFPKAFRFLGSDEIIRAGQASAQGVECLFPTCFPIKIPTIPCFPPCLPTCSPKPTPTGIFPSPTEVVPSPTPEKPTPTLPSEPTPTSPPPVGGPVEEVPAVGVAQVCGAQTPPTPYLKSVTTIKIGEVELVWDPVEPVTHYSISYGPSAGNYLYGVPNTGKVTSFRVGALGSGNYCFIVRAVNDCAPSGPSNEICTGRITPQVLGVSVLGPTGKEIRLWQILFIIGGICGTLGVRICFLKPKRALF